MLKSRRIAVPLVTGDTPPVQGFGSDVRIGQVGDDIIVPVLCLLPLLPGKCRVSKAEFELSKKVVRRQETLKLMSLGSVGIQNLDRRSPLRTEALKRFWLLLDMDLYRKIVVIDEFLDARIRVYLGIQPGASPSHGRCIEIQQQGSSRRP